MRKSHERVLLVGETVGAATVGLVYLASYLRRHGIEAYCQWYDHSRTLDSLRANVERLIDRFQPTLLGVSVKWFPHMARAIQICNFAKSHAPHIEVVLGGNTASFYWREFIREPAVDYIIRGDGELPLLRLCRAEFPVPNLIARDANTDFQLPPEFSYTETAQTDDVYLSHLDSIFVDAGDARHCGSFFIYSGKRCNKKCFYCGGCATAMHDTFGSARPFFRRPDFVRSDLETARPHTQQFLFDFDFEPEGQSQESYFREIFRAPWLSDYSAYFYFWRLPQAGSLEFLAKTFGPLTTTIDLASLSERHRFRMQADKRLGVKPQPSDDEIIAVFEQAERHPNHTIDINLISGMPLMEAEDFDLSLEMLRRLDRNYHSLGEIQWGPLHAQPGAPILNCYQEFGLHSSAVTYQDFMGFSKLNLAANEYPDWRQLRYPPIYTKNAELLEQTIRHYEAVNAFFSNRRAAVGTSRSVRRGPVQLL
jgi:hypothetical protein